MVKRQPEPDKLVIGAAELIDLPDFHVHGLAAKVDTGARSSALDVEEIEELPGGWVRFWIVTEVDRDGRRRVHATARLSRKSRVRSSTGRSQTRYFVKTTLRLGPLEHEIELSLSTRPDLRYRMLLGRTALGKAVLIDPARRYVATRRKKSKAGPSLGKKKKKKKLRS